MNKHKPVALVLLVMCAAVSCKNNGIGPTDGEISFKSDTVSVDPSSPVAGRLSLFEVTESPFLSELLTEGTAKAVTGRYAEVVLPFDGRITSSMVSQGQKVRAGQPLFEIYSPEFNNLVRDYWQARRTSERVSTEYSRKKVLYESGAISRRELDEIYNKKEDARHDMESAIATLKVYNADIDKVIVGQPVSILAPISGEVVICSIAPGEYVKAGDSSPITIANLDRMWVTASVREDCIGRVSADGRAEVFAPSGNGMPIEASIHNIGNLVDEQTRSIQVVLACDNASRRLKYGMSVSVHFVSEPHQELVVPSTAVLHKDQMDYVFVATPEEGVYLRRKVTLGEVSGNGKQVCIVSGLSAGEILVAEGGIYLADLYE